MTQPSNAASTCAAQWKMWLIKVLGVIYLAAVCAAEEEEDVTALFSYVSPTVPMPAVTPAFVPPKPSLKLETSWPDVFEDEMVEFICTVDGSDWTIIWERNGERVDLQESDPNMSLSAGGSVLKMTAATKAYAGSYSCKGQHKTKGVSTDASDSLELKVNDKPKLTVTRNVNFAKMFPGESIIFTCSVGESSGWEYLWYHNGSEIQASGADTLNIVSIDHQKNGQYHCKAKRGKGPFFTAESAAITLQVSDPPKPTLKLRTRWPDVFEGEIVELSCEVDSADWTVTWYKNQAVIHEDSILTLSSNPDGAGSLLKIASVSRTHQGGYACKAHLTARGVISDFSDTTDIKVYDNLPTPTLTKEPGFSPMYVGETVNFICKVDVSTGWTYLWYKDGESHPDASQNINETFSIRLDSSNKGKYSCKATRGKEIFTDFSKEIHQDVLEIPVPSLKNITEWLDVFPTERVKLSCGMMDGSSDWTYTWYKDGQQVLTIEAASFDADKTTLSISSASKKHEGQYECKGDLKSRPVSSSSSLKLILSVYDEKPSVALTQVPDYEVMFPGESVSFSCHINISSGWTYLWHKDNHEVSAQGVLNISSVGTADSGTYTCLAKRGRVEVFRTDASRGLRLEVKESKPKPSITQQPNADKVYVGESVTFECKVELSSDWEYLWFKNKEPLSNTSSSFIISDASSSHGGTYECLARRAKTKYNAEHSDGRSLHIYEIPVPSLKNRTQWLDVFPTESLELSCGMMDGSSDWTYMWYRDGQQVLPNEAASFDPDKTTLSISSASTSHRGLYTCSAKLKSRSVSSTNSSALRLDVYDEKPAVRLVQNPEHDVMHTGDDVFLSCHVNASSGWEYLWFKGSSRLHVTGSNHTILSAETKDSGSYKCQTKRKSANFRSDPSQAVTFKIEERPQASIVLKTGWSEAFSTDSLVLECEVKESANLWNYAWYREGQQISEMHPGTYTVTPKNDPEQSQYTCKGFRDGRPSYSKMSESFKTKNLLLKRRVLLSISGCIVFGIAAVFIGCIVLRVVRKPADNEDKQEESNLFLTMAQLKDCSDAPCPLVEYITDAALNAPPKEEEENGTICSETTPLPITTEDQAVTADNHDTTENNGGLVSFKQ